MVHNDPKDIPDSQKLSTSCEHVATKPPHQPSPISSQRPTKTPTWGVLNSIELHYHQIVSLLCKKMNEQGMFQAIAQTFVNDTVGYFWRQGNVGRGHPGQSDEVVRAVVNTGGQ